MNKNRFQNSRGSILIAILGMVAMLAVFVVAVNRQVSQELTFGRWIMERRVSLELAKAGVQRMLFELQTDKIEAFDALNESWSSNETIFHGNKMGEGDFSVVCTPGQGYDPADKGIRYGACDESARLSLNIASPEQLKNLFLAAASDDLDIKQADAIAQAIIDWRDPDNSALPSGAESNQYKSLSKPYEARNGAFETVEELQMVKGITPAIYEKVKPFLTVYTNGKININTAPREVLQAFGLGEELAGKIVELRQGLDKIEGTRDDQFFQYTDGISAAILAGAPLSPQEVDQLSNLINPDTVDVKSDVFRIYSIGRLIRGSRMSETRVTAVAERSGRILYWSENQ